MLPNAVDFLLKAQAEDGSWGYSLAGKGLLEPTAVVLLALRNYPRATPAVQKAIKWILSFQNQDGGWGICPQDKESGWQTAWAVYALTQLGFGKEECAKGIQWLLDVDVMQFKDTDLLETGEKVAQIDFSLRGWPWLQGESSWVEPTALAMLALKGFQASPDAAARLSEAVHYLRDRRCDGGGWNVGNPAMFNAHLPPRVTPSALALLALSEISPIEILAEDFQALRKEMFRDGGVMALTWGLMTLHMLGEEDAETRSAVVSAQDADGSWDENPYLTAIASMALGGGS